MFIGERSINHLGWIANPEQLVLERNIMNCTY